jgi:Uma2 family endonuclease
MSNMAQESFKREPKSDRIKEQLSEYGETERYETIAGIRYDMKPSPLIDHQVLVTRLWQAIDQTCDLDGIIVVAPMDVHFDEDNIVQPDVIFISNANLSIIHGKKIHGTPNLLIEILSPSSGAHDKIRKKALYEKFGVPEYWIVDPILKTVDRFALNDGNMQLLETYGEEDRIESDLLPCIQIRLSEVFGALKRIEGL